MRFEVASAHAMGIALPVLETLRRRTNFETISGYVDDFIAGGLLLYAGRLAAKGRPQGPVLLAVAWAVLCGGLYGSFFGQLGREADVSGLPNPVVVAVKGALFAWALLALSRSVRFASRPGEIR